MKEVLLKELRANQARLVNQKKALHDSKSAWDAANAKAMPRLMVEAEARMKRQAAIVACTEAGIVEIEIALRDLDKDQQDLLDRLKVEEDKLGSSPLDSPTPPASGSPARKR